MTRRYILPAAAAFALAALTAVPALAANPPGGSCFYARQWQDWRSPAPNVILLRVGVNDVYRLDLANGGSDQLQYPDVHLTNRHEVSPWLCGPTDFDLLVSDDHGIFAEPLFVTAVTKLSADEVAAIPAKFRP
jgi:hypothetical protein